MDGRDNVAEYCLGTNPWRAPLTYHVSPSGSDTWDGLAPAWDGQSGPKATIQAAIDATDRCEGDTVLLADGTYSGAGNKELDFHGNGAAVRSDADDPAVCIIDSENDGRAFDFHSHETHATVVSGLTIQNGRFPGPYAKETQGGAIRCIDASPTIVNCLLRDNCGEFGGAMYLSGSDWRCEWLLVHWQRWRSELQRVAHSIADVASLSFPIAASWATTVDFTAAPYTTMERI